MGTDPEGDAMMKQYASELTRQNAYAYAYAERVAHSPESFHEDEVLLANALLDEKMEHDLLKEMLSKPEVDEFYEGMLREGGHQVQKWGHAHDRSKSAENWFWLVGYLAGKALRASITGDMNKAKHHCISAATTLFQWHKAIKREETGTGTGEDADLKAKNSSRG